MVVLVKPALNMTLFFLSESDPIDFAKKMYESLNEKYWESELVESRKKIAKIFSPEKISSEFLLQFNCK